MLYFQNADEASDGLDEHDIDLICQMFWLPYSHGPKVCFYNKELGKKKWINKKIYEWLNAWMDKWVNKRMNKWWEKRMNKLKN